MLRAGCGKAIITPEDPKGHILAGYIRRKGVSLGVHDDIYVKTLILETGEEKVVIASFDLLGIDEHLYEYSHHVAREIMGDETVLLVAGTHTHSAPATPFQSPLLTFGYRAFSKDYFDYILESFEDAVVQAEKSLSPVRLQMTRSKILGVATDREDPSREIDDIASLIVMSSTHGERCGFLHYAVHPTVLGPDNLYISRDLVGYAADYLEKHLGLKTCLFLNGAAGNVSTRFVRRQQSFGEAERLGTLLAEQVAENIPVNSRDWTEAVSLQIQQLPVEIRLKAPLRKLEEASQLHIEQRPEEGRKAEAVAEGVELIQRLAELEDFPTHARTVISFLRISDIFQSVWLPFETPSTLSLELREAQAIPTLVVSYANGYFAYIAPSHSKGYEKVFELIEDEDRKKIFKMIRKLL
ncbi:MAG: neutral/alkaline non-lysosomal ceramidase N-terminal domain-containing protein [Infirmifilum sp.]